MDTQKIDHILKFALAAASQEDDFNYRIKAVSLDIIEMPVQQTKAKISAKERKRRKDKRAEIKARFKERAEKAKRHQEEGGYRKPVYDDVFLEGVAWLDSLAGEPLSEGKGKMTFSDDVWSQK